MLDIWAASFGELITVYIYISINSDIFYHLVSHQFYQKDTVIMLFMEILKVMFLFHCKFECMNMLVKHYSVLVNTGMKVVMMSYIRECLKCMCCFSLQDKLVPFTPDFVSRNILLSARARALKKKDSKKDWMIEYNFIA